MARASDADRFHSRKHPRLKNFRYTTPGYYFVTICTHDKQHLFGEPGGLNACGILAQDGFNLIQSHFPGIRVDKYVVMPNHVHAIMEVVTGSDDLCIAVGHYKAHVTREIHRIQPGLPVWQSSFHDHVIRNQEDYRNIWNYIDGNPQNWEKDCFFSR